MPDPNNILDFKSKTAWLCVPKVANGAVKAALLRWRGVPVPAETFPLHNHPSFHFVSAEVLNGYDHYTRIAFVRNPWDRLLSCWADKCSKEGFWESISMFGLRTGMSFKDFVRVICSQPDREQNIHYRPMSALLTWREQPVYDYLCRFERLNEDWEHLRGMIAGLPSLERNNQSTHRDWRAQYDEESFALVAWRYATDIVRFGYAEYLNEKRSDCSDGAIPRRLHGIGSEVAQPAQGSG